MTNQEPENENQLKNIITVAKFATVFTISLWISPHAYAVSPHIYKGLTGSAAAMVVGTTQQLAGKVLVKRASQGGENTLQQKNEIGHVKLTKGNELDVAEAVEVETVAEAPPSNAPIEVRRVDEAPIEISPNKKLKTVDTAFFIKEHKTQQGLFLHEKNKYSIAEILKNPIRLVPHPNMNQNECGSRIETAEQLLKLLDEDRSKLANENSIKRYARKSLELSNGFMFRMDVAMIKSFIRVFIPQKLAEIDELLKEIPSASEIATLDKDRLIIARRLLKQVWKYSVEISRSQCEVAIEANVNFHASRILLHNYVTANGPPILSDAFLTYARAGKEIIGHFDYCAARYKEYCRESKAIFCEWKTYQGKLQRLSSAMKERERALAMSHQFVNTEGFSETEIEVATLLVDMSKKTNVN